MGVATRKIAIPMPSTIRSQMIDPSASAHGTPVARTRSRARTASPTTEPARFVAVAPIRFAFCVGHHRTG